MKKLFTILIVLCSLAGSAQQNMPSLGYRFWGWTKIGGGLNDNVIPNPYVAVHIGHSGASLGVFMQPCDSTSITSPVQGLVIALSTDLGRWYIYNGTHWERMGGGSGGGGGGPFEVPLTFNSGLTRTTNTIQLGGALLHNTFIDEQGFFLALQNGKFGIRTSLPAYDLDVNGSARVSALPYLFNRDTFLTYDPVTQQIGATSRPHCADSASTLDLVVGTDIGVGATSFNSTSLISKSVKVWREGLLQTPDLFSFNSNSGVINVSPAANYKERFHVEYLCLYLPPGSVILNSITTQSGQPITTQSGQIIIF